MRYLNVQLPLYGRAHLVSVFWDHLDARVGQVHL